MCKKFDKILSTVSKVLNLILNDHSINVDLLEQLPKKSLPKNLCLSDLNDIISNFLDERPSGSEVQSSASSVLQRESDSLIKWSEKIKIKNTLVNPFFICPTDCGIVIINN